MGQGMRLPREMLSPLETLHAVKRQESVYRNRKGQG